MTYLIDTHILLWYMAGDVRIDQRIIDEIENDDNDLFLSKASLWEIAIKLSTGKLKLAMPILELEDYLYLKSITELDFTIHDLNTLSALPFHHQDPFDRLIISQALTKNYTIITDDNKFKLYTVQLLNNK